MTGRARRFLTYPARRGPVSAGKRHRGRSEDRRRAAGRKVLRRHPGAVAPGDPQGTDPNPALGRARSTRAHAHPFLSDPAVRKALSMAIDRRLLAETGLRPGRSGHLQHRPRPARLRIRSE